MNKILVTGSSVEDRFFQPLRDSGFSVKNPTQLLSEEELARELSDSIGYLLGGDEVASAPALKKATKLRVISFLGVGYESFIDVRAARDLGITITNTPGTLTNTVAELTVGQLINARRHLTQYCIAFAKGETGREEKQYDLAGHQIGIVGLGAIGTRIAEILVQGFRSPVSYYSRTQKPREEQRLGIQYMSLEQVMRTSEAVVVMVTGNPDTKGLISERLMKLMPRGAILVNTARPDIVDAEGLANCLEAGLISVAVLDGFYDGPKEIVDRLRPFLLDKLLVTGHIGSLTHDARDAMAQRSVNSLLNILTGKSDEYVAVRGNR